ncbi:NucA/NucB deoxyribonuclease domain-containing protein [Amycolatopsis sp.]|uniref:NucA/NucB deoxyribonuclease domain-containing protein n=1 Tax=Amycolatopsis sp. TaxID=37632 RepID=UPI0034597882
MLIDENKYPESAEHVQEAQSGLIWRGDDSQQKAPKPEEVTIDRAGADDNRRESLNGIATRSGDDLDRDEYPPAMFAEGGAGASVKYIDASDNRGAGSSMGHQLRGLQDGDKVHIVAG